jgi:hypothetical protein
MTLDQVIRRMYAAMCFSAGEQPDWAAQAEVFAPAARLVRVNDAGVFEFDVVTFRQNYQDMIAAGALSAFWEAELWRETHIYGDVAHVLSAYEMRISPEGEVLGRAIKSIQLFRRDDRWWISSMLWRREGAQVTVSAERPRRQE